MDERVRVLGDWGRLGAWSRLRVGLEFVGVGLKRCVDGMGQEPGCLDCLRICAFFLNLDQTRAESHDFL